MIKPVAPYAIAWLAKGRARFGHQFCKPRRPWAYRLLIETHKNATHKVRDRARRAK